MTSEIVLRAWRQHHVVAFTRFSYEAKRFTRISHVQTLSFGIWRLENSVFRNALAQEEANKSFYFHPNMHIFVSGCLTRVCLLYRTYP